MDSAYTAQGRKFCFAFFEMKEDLYEKKRQREGTGVFFFDRFS